MTAIALLGDRNPEYLTHRELDAALHLFPEDVTAEWVPTDDPDSRKRVAESDALWVVPGTPYRDDSFVYESIQQAREGQKPFLGTCGGFQYALVEYARNVTGLSNASHGEESPQSEDQVVTRLSCSLVGEEREVSTIDGTRLRTIYGHEPFMGFHYCNFGLAEHYVDQLSDQNLIVSARAIDAGVEGIELSDHPFYIATLFQPQVGSIAGKPLDPLIARFIEAASAS